jgi:pSer/pThr/pTyr-binding forkhead associated (FHA) protein
MLSTTGTTVNGEKRVLCYLDDNDEIGVGNAILVLHTAKAESTSASAQMSAQDNGSRSRKGHAKKGITFPVTVVLIFTIAVAITAWVLLTE